MKYLRDFVDGFVSTADLIGTGIGYWFDKVDNRRGLKRRGGFKTLGYVADKYSLENLREIGLGFGDVGLKPKKRNSLERKFKIAGDVLGVCCLPLEVVFIPWNYFRFSGSVSRSIGTNIDFSECFNG